MSYTCGNDYTENNSTSKLTNDIKINIEKRKELVSTFKNTYLQIDNFSNEIRVNKLHLEDLLDEFEFTISQSLQAFKTLEIENSNLKEIVLSKNSKKESHMMDSNYNSSRKEILHPDNPKLSLDNESDLINYQFQSPTHNAPDIVYSNNFEEMSFSPNTGRETEANLDTFRVDAKEILANKENNKYVQNLQNVENVNTHNYHFEDTFGNEEEFSNFAKQNEENKNIPKSNNFIYHKNTNLSSFRTSNSSQNSLANTFSKTNDLSNPTPNNNINNLSYLTYSKGLNLNFDYSTIENFKDVMANDNNNKEETKTLPNFAFKTEDTADTKNGFKIPSDLEPPNEDTLYIKQGLRQKLIKCRSNSSTISHNRNSPSNKSRTIDTYNEEIESDRLYNRHQFNTYNADKNYETNNHVDTEATIPHLNSKRNCFSIRLQDLDRETTVNNILRKIEKADNNVKQYVANKYANGSFDNFLFRLNNSNMNLGELENDLNMLVGIGTGSESNSKKNIPINQNSERKNGTSKKNNNNSVTSQNDNINNSFNKSKSELNKRARTPKIKSISSKENYASENTYIEPVKFEAFLRNSKKKKEIIKKACNKSYHKLNSTGTSN